jgi:hypothetical protein
MVWIWAIPIVLVFVFGFVVFRGAPYIPSQKKLIKIAFSELYKISKKDVLVDIGSGDGVVLRAASGAGAHAIGFEINPILVVVSRILSRKDSHIKVRMADFWISHLPPDTTVVYVFSVGRDMKKIEKWMQKETTRIGHTVILISFGFGFKNIKADKIKQPYFLYVFHPLHQVKPQV